MNVKSIPTCFQPFSYGCLAQLQLLSDLLDSEVALQKFEYLFLKTGDLANEICMSFRVESSRELNAIPKHAAQHDLVKSVDVIDRGLTPDEVFMGGVNT
ncbi:MAG: hypothetical protein AAF704_16830 [Cyanobacteria bacterium P01_D01_bin.123]